MKLHRDAARMIILKDGQLLVMERWRRDEETSEMLHYFSIPGGGIEAGEAPAETAVREVEEEMGISVELGREVAIVDTSFGRRFYFVGYHTGGVPFLHPDSPEAIQTDPDNRFEPKWIPLDELNEKNCHPDYVKLLPLIREINHGKIPDEPWHISLDDL